MLRLLAVIIFLSGPIMASADQCQPISASINVADTGGVFQIDKGCDLNGSTYSYGIYPNGKPQLKVTTSTQTSETDIKIYNQDKSKPKTKNDLDSCIKTIVTSGSGLSANQRAQAEIAAQVLLSGELDYNDVLSQLVAICFTDSN